MAEKGKLRDSQRSKLYNAEYVFREDDNGRRFDGVEEVQAYVDKLVGSAWFQRRWAIDRIFVSDGRGRRRGYAYVNHFENRRRLEITLPQFARNEEYVLHEVAHCCTARTQRDSYASHGWQFARTLLELVGHKMGKQARRDLIEQFQLHRVRHRKPPELSEAQRQVLRDRMAKVRTENALP